MSDQKEIKEGTVTIFKVDDSKKKSEKSPDFTGSGRLKSEDIDRLKENGGVIRLSVWTKLSKSGLPYISGFVEAQQDNAFTPAPPSATNDFMMTPAIKKAMENAEDTQVISEDDNSGLPF